MNSLNSNLHIQIPKIDDDFGNSYDKDFSRYLSDDSIMLKSKVNYNEHEYNLIKIHQNNQIENFIDQSNPDNKCYAISPLIVNRFELAFEMIKTMEIGSLVPIGFDGFYVEVCIYKTYSKKLYMIKFHKNKIMECFLLDEKHSN